MQEQVNGGLSPSGVGRLRSLTSDPNKNRAALTTAPALKPGSRLLREWHGRTHSVIALEGGFDYGERYRSLSEIARRIIGSHRSRPAFFGFKRRSPAPAAKTDNE